MPPYPSTRDLVFGVLRRKPGAATTPRNLAAWLDRPVGDVREVLRGLQEEALARPLRRGSGREAIWVVTGPFGYSPSMTRPVAFDSDGISGIVLRQALEMYAEAKEREAPGSMGHLEPGHLAEHARGMITRMDAALEASVDAMVARQERERAAG